MKRQDQVEELARKTGAKCICRDPDWNGREVWFLNFDMPGEPFSCIGIPTYAIFDKNRFRLMDDSEVMDYLAYLNANGGDEGDVPEDEDETFYPDEEEQIDWIVL